MPRRGARPRLRTADVEPVDVDGVRTMAIGTIAWALGLVVLVAFRARLEAAGDGWVIWTGVSGVVLGLAGLAYCLVRRQRASRRIQRRTGAGSTAESNAEPGAESNAEPGQSTSS